jgi:chemotaxis protein methyltransferase CheR
MDRFAMTASRSIPRLPDSTAATPIHTMIRDLNYDEFRLIADIAYQRWGLSLPDTKMPMVSGRLASYARRIHLNSVEEFIERLKRGDNEADLLAIFDMLSTNVTAFFRDPEHFNYLERELYTGLSRGTLTLPGRKLRIWSAACSTGAEPYSLAIHALEHLAGIENWDVRILATDLSESALAVARRGVYPLDMVAGLDRELLKRYFLRGLGPSSGYVKVTPQVREMVTVHRLNLMENWPMKGPFQVIFCRNVMIYFDSPTKQRLVQRMYDLLDPGGLLVLGSAETLSGLGHQFRHVQPSIYAK